MDIFKSKGRFAKGGTKHINKPTTHQERTHHTARPFFLRVVRKGKRNYKTKQERKDKTKGQAKDNQNKADKVKDKKQVKR